MRCTGFSVFIDESTQSLDICRPDGLRMCKQFQVLLHILKHGRLIKGKLQLVAIQQMKNDANYLPPGFKNGWRKELLGKNLLALMGNRDVFDITIKKNKFILSVSKRSRLSLSLAKIFKKGQKE